MSNRIFIHILICLAAFLAVSCNKEKQSSGSDPLRGKGNLHITVDNPQTKLSASEGDVMKTLSLWLVSKSDASVMAFKSVSFTEVSSSHEVLIEDIQRGDYRLYVLANCTDLDADYTEGKTIDNNFTQKLLPEISSGTAPSFSDETGMPCSIAQDVSITAGENYVSAHLLRCVGKLSFQFRNNISDRTVAIANVGLSKMNPTVGYLFDPDDHSIPSSADTVAFKDIADNDNIIVIDPNKASEVYTTYLYETPESNSTNGMSFQLFGALYDLSAIYDDIKVAYKNQYDISDNITAAGDASGLYLIRSAASDTYYVGVDNAEDKLTVHSFTSDDELLKHSDFEYYLWEISDASSATLVNYATGLYITLNGATASLSEKETDATVFTISSSSDKFSFKNSDGYSLTYENVTGVIGTTGKESDDVTKWNIRRSSSSSSSVAYFVNSDYDIPLVKRPITYIDQYGNSQKLTKISRNEHVTVTVNIFYNRELAQFDFEVEGWSSKESETTFD